MVLILLVDGLSNYFSNQFSLTKKYFGGSNKLENVWSIQLGHSRLGVILLLVAIPQIILIIRLRTIYSSDISKKNYQRELNQKDFI